MARNRDLLTVAGVVALFTVLVATIIVLAARKTITPELALLMLFALVGMYFGFGVLIAVYRFVSKLE
jgi:ABC-type maltose transport system permease subunit